MTGKTAGIRYFGHTFSLRQAAGWLGIVLLIALLGAHFFRASAYGLVLCCAGVFLLHCGHTEWKRYAVSFFLLWGAVEWGETALFLAQARMQAGIPWFRAALILWGVACVTGLGALALYRQQAGTEGKDDYARLKGIVFLISFGAIHYLARYSPIPLLLLERFFPGWGGAQIFFIAWYGVWVATLLLDPKRSRKGRKLAWLLFSLLFYSQLALGILVLERMLMTGTLHIPVPGFIVFGPLFRGTLSMMAGLVLVATLLTGSAWCSMLCYFGPFDAIAAGNKPVKPLPPSLRWTIRYGRLCVLAAGSLVAVALPLTHQPLTIALPVAGLFVGASFFIMGRASRKYNSMMHCTTFCPMGIVINALAKISPWRIRVEPEQCDHCGACEAVCKYRAISASSRTLGKTACQCSLCMDCIPACTKQAITLRAVCIPVSNPTARHIFIVLLVAIHAIFIAFARG
ncbi:MAG: 4Fe-4S binding protein [Desulfobulbus sp.]|nr:4Fe-4S binding protein [Desulfobulbus sp.]